MWRTLRTHLFGGKKLTFLYVPDNASVRQFMVPRIVFYALAGAAVLALGLLAFFGSRYLSAAAEGRQCWRCAAKTLQLRDHLMICVADRRAPERDAPSLELQQNCAVASPRLDPVLQAGQRTRAARDFGDSLTPETRADLHEAGRDLSRLAPSEAAEGT
jgi:hypothetical protein